MTDRPAAVAKAREQLKAIKPTVAAWGESKPWITDEEKEKLLDHVEKALAWFDEKETAQKLKKSTEDAVFQSIDVKPQLKMVEIQLEKLLKKPKPVPPKSEPNATITVNGTVSLNETEFGSNFEGETNSTTTENPSGESTTDSTAQEPTKKTDDEL